MRLDSVELFFLEIPFKLSLSHGAHSGRISSDSIVLCVRAGDRAGWGEAVVREYVSGSLGSGAPMQDEAVRVVARLLQPLRDRDISWEDAAAHFAGLPCEPSALPLLCAAESAVLACAVEEAGTDAYSVLKVAPLRSAVTYGVVIPFVAPEAAKGYLGMCAQAGITNLKVKVGADVAYNSAILGLCRAVLGREFDLRVDANSSWDPVRVDAQLEACARNGVTLIEQPFAATTAPAASARLAGLGFSVMADEGVLTSADVRALASSGAAQVLNLRLSKNGGLGRVRALAAEAETCGLAYQLGCMVGETGILSGMGRLTASLLPRPRYVEGSYDELLLEANIVSPSFGFGPGGKAPIVRTGTGYRVVEENLRRFTRAQRVV